MNKGKRESSEWLTEAQRDAHRHNETHKETRTKRAHKSDNGVTEAQSER